MTEPFAADIAPLIDKTVIAMHRAVGPTGGQLVRQAGLPNAGLLVDLLIPLLAGPADIPALHSIERYTPYERFIDGIEQHVAQGMLRRSGGVVTATPAGLELLRDVRRAQGIAISELWSDRSDAVARLRPLADKVLNSVDDPGPAFSLQKPPVQADSAAQGLHDRLTSLRYYRADAHAAAWQAAGLTTAEMVAGPPRETIEAETNRLAARPYKILFEGERDSFLDALKALALSGCRENRRQAGGLDERAGHPVG